MIPARLGTVLFCSVVACGAPAGGPAAAPTPSTAAPLAAAPPTGPAPTPPPARPFARRAVVQPPPLVRASWPVDFELFVPDATPPSGPMPLLYELSGASPTPPRDVEVLAVLVPIDVVLEMAPGGLRSVPSLSAGAPGFRLSFDRGAALTPTFGPNGRPCVSRPPPANFCGLDDEVQLVRVVLSGAGPRLRGKLAARADRTPGFPLDMGSAARDFVLAGFQSAESGSLGAKLTAMLDERQKARPRVAELERAGVHTQVLGRFGAWVDEKAREIVLVFYAHRIESRSTAVTVKNPHPLAGTFGCEAPPGADCAPRNHPATVTERIEQRWSAEVALERRLRPDGTIIAERERESQRTPEPAVTRTIVGADHR